MKLRRQAKAGAPVVFEEIEPFFLDLLRRLPAFADPGDNPAARARIYSAPMARGMDGDEFNEDWERYVEPELRSLFRTAQQTVEADLAKLPALTATEPMSVFEAGAFTATALTLEIPSKHTEAWLSVLNQARLVIAARRGFGERDMEQEQPFPPLNDRDLDLFRVNFYDDIQQILLRELDAE